MSKILGRTVYLPDPDTGEYTCYLGGEPVSDDVAKRITNPSAWEVDEGDEPMGVDVNADTVSDIENWVGDSAVRASRVLEAERSRDKGPRSSLIAKLQEIAGQAG